MAGPVRQDLSGMQFGEWEVLSFCRTSSHGRQLWNCECSCGAEKVVDGWSLKAGKSMSCGHTNAENKCTHGMTHTKTYQAWSGAIQRCRSHPDYAGRGISVCDRWLKFQNFFEDMGEAPEGLTLERADNDGNYEPSNCYWATWEEQSVNKRITKLSFEGKQELIRLASKGVPNNVLAKTFSISEGYVSLLINGLARTNY